MRSANGFSKAVTRDEAIGYTIPQVAATGPTTPLPGDPMFSCDPDGIELGPTAPTSAQWHNAITEEIASVLQLGNVATPAGLALDPTDNTQMAQVLGPIRALHSAVANTGVVSNIHQRAVIASASCRATGAQSYAAASNATTGLGGSILVSGTTSRCDSSVAATAAILANGANSRVDCSIATSGAITAGPGGSAVVDGCEAVVGAITASGSESAVRSSRTTALAMTASGTAAVIESCSDGFAVAVSANYSKATACDGATIAGSHNHASASQAPTFPATATFCDVIASGGVVIPANATGCVVLASAGAATPTPAAPANQVWGGVGAAATWRINSTTGAYYGGPYNAGGADYAEMFPLLVVGDPLPERRLLAGVGRKVRLAEPGDRIRGAVSSNPAVLGDCPEDGSHSDRREWCPVALVGQVLLEFVGKVEIGDLLTAAEAGRGKKATKQNPANGRPVEVLEVVEPFDAAKGYGVALCLVG